ncbi:hypothetical protein ACFWVC_27395 [Streptomyces sp. NPDC058691]|uniref:hypothetical protein n=1 Tax=Streptomyces sp. NPDC058691 TaxID=3346601 RepID=UPI003666C907
MNVILSTALHPAGIPAGPADLALIHFPAQAPREPEIAANRRYARRYARRSRAAHRLALVQG